MSPQIISDLGFPIFSALICGGFIFFIIKFLLNSLNTKLGELSKSQVVLIDKIRMLDNDLLRIDSKIKMYINMKGLSANLDRPLQRRRSDASEEKGDT